MRPLDVAVAGCGPAGLAAALFLTRDGHRVTIYERFETPRPLGSGLMLQPTGLAVLEALELRESLVEAGARIDRLIGRTSKGRVALDVRYAALGRADAFGVGIHRATLFAALYSATRAAGVTIETGRAVASSEINGDGRRRLLFRDGPSAGPFDLVVDALGAASPLAPAAGRLLAYGALWASLDQAPSVDPTALEQRYRAAHTMCGMMPMGYVANVARPQTAFFWSLRCDRLESWRARGLEAWKAEVAALWPETQPLLDQIESEDRLTFARYRHRTLAKPAERRLVHLGDAWRCTSPQLGQGANMALLDAYALALALRSRDDLADALAFAVRLRRRHVALYQGMSRLFTPVYQSDSRLLPLLRDRIVGPMSRIWPATALLATIVSGGVGAPLRALNLPLRPARAPRQTAP